MSFINPQKKEINSKIVYYGAEGSGKSKNLRQIFEKTSKSSRGDIVSLSHEGDATLFFDFLPLSMGEIKNYKIKFHLYSVPGEVLYDSSRKLILKGTDGIVFVIDCRIERMEDNLESWHNLEANLANYDIDLRNIPLVLQYNHIDHPHSVPPQNIGAYFNKKKYTEHWCNAKKGDGVLECFRDISKKVLMNLSHAQN